MHTNSDRASLPDQLAPPSLAVNDQPIPAILATQWVAKGIACAAPILRLAGTVATPCDVSPQLVTSNSERPYGDFMLTWLLRARDAGAIGHLPDAGFFLQTLRLAYQPLIREQPDLGRLLTGMTRVEMAFTNDVLQIQLQDAEHYSMIRHHALMLFYAALWLEEPERSSWLALYDRALDHVVDRREGADPDSLEAIETEAFEDFSRFSATSVTSAGATSLLSEPAGLRRICRFHVCAAAAVGMLWRDYRQLETAQQDDWHRHYLASYSRQDFLAQRWFNSFTTLPQPLDKPGDSHE